MAILVIMFGVMVLNFLAWIIATEQAQAVAEAVALSSLTLLYPEAEMASTQADKDRFWQRVQTIAEANGGASPGLKPLNPSDMELQPARVRVTVHVQRGSVRSCVATAIGEPAGKIASGRIRYDSAGRPAQTAGCLPLAVSRAAFDEFADGRIACLTLDADSPAAMWVRLPGTEVDALGHLHYLSFRGDDPLTGVPPPSVERGDRLLPAPAPNELTRVLGERFTGRTVVVPLVEDDVVVGFGRLRIVSADPEKQAITASTAPSAVSALAQASHGRGVVVNTEANTPSFGMFLRARLEG